MSSSICKDKQRAKAQSPPGQAQITKFCEPLPSNKELPRQEVGDAQPRNKQQLAKG